MAPGDDSADRRFNELADTPDPDLRIVMEALTLIWERLTQVQATLKLVDDDVANWG